MQKVPYIQASPAQKKYPLQRLNPLTLSSLYYMKIIKSTVLLICNFLVTSR